MKQDSYLTSSPPAAPTNGAAMPGKRKRLIHGHARDSGWSKEYRAWRTMLFRCSPNNQDASRYADRGITVCERWRKSFVDFLADMGPKPSPKHSIDRINNDGNYEPDNCRWATIKEQSRNKSTTKLSVEEAAEILRLLKAGTARKVVAKQFGVSETTISDIKLGRRWQEAQELA